MLKLEHERYGGHRIAAAPGTHQAVLDAAKTHVSRTASVLDLGAYSGALLRRFADNGYKKLAAADIANHLTESFSFFRCDFNEPFADAFKGQKFDCVSVCEVIEHLNDPRRFLAECHKLLNDNGVIVVSTPNIAFFEGRIKFLLTGELFGFGEKNYRVQRHITPISREQFPLLFAECGFEQLRFLTAAGFASPLRKILTFPIWAPMRMLFGPHVLGETAVAVARKSTPTNQLSSQTLWGVAA